MSVRLLLVAVLVLVGHTVSAATSATAAPIRRNNPTEWIIKAIRWFRTTLLMTLTTPSIQTVALKAATNI